MLTRLKYDVAILVDDQPVEHCVEITPGDQLRTEFEAKKHGLGRMSDAPLNHTVVWIWCALVRDGHYAEDFQTFRNRDLYAFAGVDDQEDTEVPTLPESVSG